MSPKRRRTSKARRYVNVTLHMPGARQYLIEHEYESAWDPRYDPPRLDRKLLDPLERGEPVEVFAWELPGDAWRDFGDGLDAMGVRVRVDADDTVRVL